MRYKFFDIFSKTEVLEQDKEMVHKIKSLSISLENALFKANHLPRDYATKSRSLIFNLNDPKNPKLKFKILSGFIKTKEVADFCKKVVNLDSTMLASDESK